MRLRRWMASLPPQINVRAYMCQFATGLRHTGICYPRQQREYPHEQHHQDDAALMATAGREDHVQVFEW